MPTIPVSFKQTTKDMRLYTTVDAQEEKSDFVKKALEYYIEHLKKNKEEK